LESIPGLLKKVQKYGLRLHWLEKSNPWNRFLGFLKKFKIPVLQEGEVPPLVHSSGSQPSFHPEVVRYHISQLGIFAGINLFIIKLIINLLID
jgi:hypothetical protein